MLGKSRYMLWENTLRTGHLWRVEVYTVLGDRMVCRVNEWSSGSMWDWIQEEKRYEYTGGQVGCATTPVHKVYTGPYDSFGG